MLPRDESALRTLLKDPLGDVTRKERRNLLCVSIIVISIVRIGLVPTRITSLGIELTKPETTAFLWMLGSITVYFFLTYLIYALSDYLHWTIAWYDVKWDEISKQADNVKSTEHDLKGRTTVVFYLTDGDRFTFFAQMTSLVRVLFDYFLPITIALIALILLYKKLFSNG